MCERGWHTSITPRGMESCKSRAQTLQLTTSIQARRHLCISDRGMSVSLTGVTMSDLNQKILPCFKTNHLQIRIMMITPSIVSKYKLST